MSSPEWELTDADQRGVAYLGLPVEGDEARALLRGRPSKDSLRAHITEQGRFADMHSLGWPGLYALSPRMASTVERYAGVALSRLIIDGGPNDYVILGVNGRCGPADYSKSLPVGRIGKSVRLRGLYVGQMDGLVDFAVPDGLETVVVTRAVGETLRAGRFENVRLLSLKDQEFDVPEDLVTGQTKR